jgi:2-methylcitrate dehydratase PrpD
MAKVDVVADAECTDIFPHQFPAVLTAELTDGRTVVEKVLTTRGGPQRPLSFDEIAAKFATNAGRNLDNDAVATLSATCRDLAGASTMDALLAPLTLIDS